MITIRRLVLAAVLATGAVAGAQPALAGPAEPSVPSDRIAVEDGNKVFLVGHATGVQIYTCLTTSSGYAWSAATPRAELRDDNGKLLATHYGGPTWEARDGSKVVGRRVDGVTVDTSAIPWLLLSAASTSAGPDGARLAGTTFIQRLNTAGGLTPAADQCNAGTAGTATEVPYTADYYFWKKQG